MNIKQKIKNIFLEETAFAFSVPAILWQLLFLYIPLIIVIYLSFKVSINSAWYKLTDAHYYALFKIEYMRIIMRSTGIALIVVFFCLLLAYPVAYFLALKVKRRWKNLLLFLLTLPFWTNFLIQVYSWVFVLDHNGLINTILLKLGFITEPLHMVNNIYAIFLVMVHYYLPFMIMPLYSILEKIQHDVLEASMDLGATHWQTFTRITIPLSLSGIKTGILLVFVPAFGEFVIPSLIGGSKYMYVGSLITHYFLVARDNQLGAAFTIISGLVLLFCALLFNWLCDIPYKKIEKEQRL
jgi:spermidine/putrescine transport system permease protein